jgi:rod shape-determining protein MreC
VAEFKGTRSGWPGKKSGSRSSSSRGPGRPARTRSSLTFFALVSVTLIVIGQSSPLAGVRGALGSVFAPIKSVGGTVAQPVSNLFEAIGTRNRLKDDNEDLRRRLNEAQSKLAAAEDALRERREVLAMDGLEEITSFKSVKARVATSSMDNFDVTIEIDRGTADGVREGMPVAAGYGLVGQVTVVAKNAARVRLFTDPESQVGVRHATSGVVGIIRGEGRDKPMQVSRIDTRAVVKPGDVMVTSGLTNSRFPAGLQVGTVVSTKLEQGKLEQTVIMKPFIELDRLTFVSVLLWTAPPPVPFEKPVPTSTSVPLDAASVVSPDGLSADVSANASTTVVDNP